MSSYGDPHAGGWSGDAGRAGHGRAQVNRDGYGYRYDDQDDGSHRGARPDSGAGYGRAAGSAAVGSASVGRASVGRAGVPAPGSAGRASVPGMGAGRATVRPGGYDDEPGAPGGRGPGGPRGPRNGRGGGDGDRAAGGTSSDKAKKAKRMKILVASLAAFLIVFGVGAIGGTYYFDSVSEFLPENFKSAQTTMIMAADGKTQLAQLGTENRVNVPIEVIPEKVRNALIAGEDKGFYEHHGISYSGIMRAAWKNLTSDDSQGGSTITQQYIKIATEQAQISYARKLREAVLARKLEDKYSKTQIMGFYLNTIDFGRGAVGVEKAAQAYFGINKSAKDLTVAEAAVLGAVIRDPYSDGGELSIYDPEGHPDTAKERWGYVLNNMVEKGWLTQAERDQMQFPAVRKYGTVSTSAEWGIKINPGAPAGTATGNIVNYVYEELKAQGIEPKELKTGGYKVYTTIDPKAQKAAEEAARPDLKGSELYGAKADPKKKTDLQSAVVAIDHTSGAVLAYYGGLDGTAIDLAGVNTQGGKLVGGHPPGSSMKVYTLAAALEAGASLQSRWKAMPFTTDDKLKVGNAGATNTTCKDYCTLEYSYMKSYNVPFYWVARQIGPGKVVKMAHAAGVNMMWDNDNKPHDLTKEIQDDQGRSPFDRQVGFGQYGITVIDHATGVATIANGGVYNKPHFVRKVEKKDPVTGQYKVVPNTGAKSTPKQVIRRQVANDVTYGMEKVFKDHSGWSSAQGGRPVAAKTGTWEGAIVKNGAVVKSNDNAHAWVVGFTKQVSVAVWTGNAAGSAPVVDPKTKSTISSGTTPYRVWREFLSDYSKGMTKEKLAEPSHIGDDEVGFANGVSPSPSAPVDPGNGNGNCIPLVTCPTNEPGNGNQSKSPSPTPTTSQSPGPR